MNSVSDAHIGPHIHNIGQVDEYDLSLKVDSTSTSATTITAAGVTLNGGSAGVTTTTGGEATAHLTVNSTNFDLSEILFKNNLGNQGAVGSANIASRGTFLWNQADKIQCLSGAAGVVKLISSTSVNVQAPILNTVGITMTGALTGATSISTSGSVTAGTGGVITPRITTTGVATFTSVRDGTDAPGVANILSFVAGASSSVNVSGNDHAGLIKLTCTPLTSTQGTFLRVNFNTPFASPPYVIIQPATVSATNGYNHTQAINPIYVQTTANFFQLSLSGHYFIHTGTDNYQWFYHVIGQ